MEAHANRRTKNPQPSCIDPSSRTPTCVRAVAAKHALVAAAQDQVLAEPQPDGRAAAQVALDLRMG